MGARERFFKKVDRSEFSPAACWTWIGCRDSRGYSRFGWKGKTDYAHRFAWEEFCEPIESGLEIDHLCRNHSCVNPLHLEPVPHSVNHRRGNGMFAGGLVMKSKTHCPYGHPYHGDNLYVYPDGRRLCITCKRQRERERYYLKRFS
jgi:hypothetical protein